MRDTDMIGTPRQIEWAQRIRAEKLTECDELERELKAAAAKAAEPIEGSDIVFAALANVWEAIEKETSASKIIDGRMLPVKSLVRKECQRVKLEVSEVKKEEAEQSISASAAAMAEATITPNDANSGIVALIDIKGNDINVQSPKDNILRDTVKSYGFSWNGSVWARTVDKFAGSVEDRAAEIANALLNAGISVRIYDEDIRRRAVTADFVPENKKWVKVVIDGEYSGYLSISWSGKNQKIYNAARRIHGSKWYKSSVIVPVSQFAEIEDFADMLGFSISEGARAAIEAYKTSLPRAVVPATPPTTECEDKLGAILKEEADILPELMDE